LVDGSLRPQLLFLAILEKDREGTMPIGPAFDAPFYLPDVHALHRAMLFAAPGNHRNGFNHLPFGARPFGNSKSGCPVGLVYLYPSEDAPKA
jgi:hypothetical protein